MFFFAFPRRFAYSRDAAATTALLIIMSVVVFAVSPVIRGALPSVTQMKMTPEWVVWLNSTLLMAGLVPLFAYCYLMWLYGVVVEDQLQWWRYLALWAVGCASAVAWSSGMSSGAVDPISRASLAQWGGLGAIVGFFAIRNRHLPLEIAWFGWLLSWIRYDVARVPGWTGLGACALLVGGIPLLSGFTGAAAPITTPAVAGAVIGLSAALVTGQWGAARRSDSRAAAAAYYTVGLEGAAAKHANVAKRQTPEDKARLAVVALAADSRDHAARARVAESVDELLAAGMKVQAAHTWASAERVAPGSVPLEAAALHALATAAEEDGALDDAAVAYYAVHQASPHSTWGEHALFRLGHVYLASGREADAQQTYRVFASLYPQSGWHARVNPRLLAATTQA